MSCNGAGTPSDWAGPPCKASDWTAGSPSVKDWGEPPLVVVRPSVSAEAALSRVVPVSGISLVYGLKTMSEHA